MKQGNALLINELKSRVKDDNKVVMTKQKLNTDKQSADTNYEEALIAKNEIERHNTVQTIAAIKTTEETDETVHNSNNVKEDSFVTTEENSSKLDKSTQPKPTVNTNVIFEPSASTSINSSISHKNEFVDTSSEANSKQPMLNPSSYSKSNENKNSLTEDKSNTVETKINPTNQVYFNETANENDTEIVNKKVQIPNSIFDEIDGEDDGNLFSPPPMPKSIKQKSEKSIFSGFSSSDSDDDLFTQVKKVKTEPSKIHQIFDESDSDDDDLFNLASKANK